jgi:Mg-chelatase subunit ChlD
MSNKHQVHNLIILDESGSMERIKKPTIEGFNEIVQTIKGVEQRFPEQQHFISLISFNGLGRKTHLWKEPVSKLEQLDTLTYRPGASTPLYDAMGFGLSKLSAELLATDDYNVLVTIFTDGEENTSEEYTGELIKKMVNDLKTKRWTFTYIGTNHDVEQFAASLSITNVVRFESSPAGIKHAFMKEERARHRYSEKIRRNINTENNFYEEEEK